MLKLAVPFQANFRCTRSYIEFVTMILWIYIHIFMVLASFHIVSGQNNTQSQLYPDGSVIRMGRHLFFMLGGKKHAFPDRYTLHRMGFHWGSPNITTLNPRIHRLDSGPTLPSLWDHHPNMKILSLGVSKCIVAVKKVFTFSNPSIVIYKKQYVVSWRETPHRFRIVWLDKMSGFPYSNSVGKDFTTLADFNFKNSTLPSVSIDGEDPRLFVLSDGVNAKDYKLIVAFATRYPKKTPEIRMSYTELILADRKVSFDKIFTFNYEAERGKEDQKNWSPFDHHGKVFYISNGQPHRITFTGDILSPNEPNTIKAITVSASSVNNLDEFWRHGEIRGGTPAILIRDVYLTFFHSSLIPPVTGDVLRTYVFGAYIFEKDKPFAIKAMTKNPIIHDSMYSGPWTNLPESYYLIDYVAFPMSTVLSEDGKHLYLLYGKQDVEGWVAKINIDDLFASLVPVETVK